MFAEFVSQYGATILYTVVTAIAGYIGLVVKNIYQKYVDDKTKKNTVDTVVKAVKQLYKDLNGEEKLAKSIEHISELLTQRGITASELEIRMLIESAVSEMKEKAKEEQ